MNTQLQRLISREQEFLAACFRVSKTGIQISREQLDFLEARNQKATVKARKHLEVYGEFNPDSPKQVAEILEDLGAELPLTPKGNISTRADVLERLAEEEEDRAGDFARLILEYRKPGKATSAFLKPMRLLLDTADGRARPKIFTLGADATGRCSAADPNIQQWPREGGYREMFVADPGYKFISADFSSVEVRIAAWASGDLVLAKMLREGIDLHSVVAEIVWGEDFTPAQRTAAKRSVFGRLYGAGMPTMARQLGEYRDKVFEVRDAIGRAAPGLAAWGAQMREDVSRGRRPFWPHPSGRRTYLPSDESHKALNYPIQSTGRELLVDAVLEFEARRPGHVIFPVHDEIVALVPEGEAEAALADLTDAMTTRLPMHDGSFVAITCEPGGISSAWQSSG